MRLIANDPRPSVSHRGLVGEPGCRGRHGRLLALALVPSLTLGVATTSASRDACGDLHADRPRTGDTPSVVHDAVTQPMASVDFEAEGATVSVLPSPPSVPADWHLVSSDAGDLRMFLPPEIVAFDTSGAVFANEPPAADGTWLEVMAEGPYTSDLQPAADEPLVAWLERRWLDGAPERGPTLIRSLLLPAGEAIELSTSVAPGTDDEWWIRLYAISTPEGVGLLVIDGPPSAWHRLHDEAELIPQLIELPPTDPAR